jgi:hypothetical protein
MIKPLSAAQAVKIAIAVKEAAAKDPKGPLAKALEKVLGRKL